MYWLGSSCNGPGSWAPPTVGFGWNPIHLKIICFCIRDAMPFGSGHGRVYGVGLRNSCVHGWQVSLFGYIRWMSIYSPARPIFLQTVAMYIPVGIIIASAIAVPMVVTYAPIGMSVHSIGESYRIPIAF